MISRLTRCLFLAVLGLLSGSQVMGQQHAGTTLRFIPHADVTILDPYWTPAYITRNYGYMVYDTLFAMNSELRPQPQMVDTWTLSDDKLTYNFTLREGLKFHDGQPVRATDVVASLKRWGKRDLAYGQPLLAAATAIEPIGDRQFRIELRMPFPVLEALATLNSPTPFIMPDRLAETDPFTQIKEAIGSGPFKFVKEEWQPGHKVVYVRNPDYVPRPEPPSWAAGGKVAKVDRIEWLYIPEAVTAAQALGNAEVDYWENVPTDYTATLEHDPNVSTQSFGGLIGIVRFNHLNAFRQREDAPSGAGGGRSARLPQRNRGGIQKIGALAFRSMPATVRNLTSRAARHFPGRATSRGQNGSSAKRTIRAGASSCSMPPTSPSFTRRPSSPMICSGSSG